MTAPVLSVEGLGVAYDGKQVVDAVSFDLRRGETLALVGLSGCGKTTVLRAILGLLPPSARVEGRLTTSSGTVNLSDRPSLRRRLGREIGFVAQNPFDACAPLRTVLAHIAEAWRAHGLRPDARRIEALCARLGLDRTLLDRHPHEWSGGMLQRANIAAALALDPPVLVADEPTSALDAAHADAVMACLSDRDRAVLVVSHDLSLVRRHARRLVLLSGGRVRARVDATEDLPGPLSELARMATVAPPPLPSLAAPAVLEVERLAIDRGGRRILSDVSLALGPGEVLGVAGASGRGKTSLLATLAGRLPPAEGSIRRGGQIRAPRPGEVLPLFQDALSSVNLNWSLHRIVSEPLTVRSARKRPDHSARQALSDFGLGMADPEARPWQLSSGQVQRLTLARASLAGPGLVLADEPTSALDPLQKANALAGLARLAMSSAAIVLVSHDTRMLSDFCHRVIEL